MSSSSNEEQPAFEVESGRAREQTRHKRQKVLLLVLVGLLLVAVIILPIVLISKNNETSIEPDNETTFEPGNETTPYEPENEITLYGNPTEAAKCDVAPYQHVESPAACSEIEPGHTNWYWGNEKFICRLNQRPCDAGDDIFYMDLGNDAGILNLQDPLGGPGEVWLFFADKEGNPKYDSSNFCFHFRAEGHWYASEWTGPSVNKHESESVYPGTDVNDYVFESLVCCEPQEDHDGSRFYIIIDGVLVDSCPKQISRNCRQC